MLGKLAQVFAGLIAVPYYVHYLGEEAWGIIGTFLVIQSFLGILDLGLSMLLNKEAARLRTATDGNLAILSRTCEAVYWLVALTMGAAFVLAIPWVAGEWITTTTMSSATVSAACLCQAVQIAVRWPGFLYTSALAGLERQIGPNLVQIGALLAQHVGGIILLDQVARSLPLLIAWHAALGAVSTAILAAMWWRSCPQRTQARVHWRVLSQHRGFCFGAVGVAASAALLTQIDRLAVSAQGDFTAFGRYTLAWMIAGSLSLVMSPVMTASFPRLCRALADPDPEVQRLEYRRFSWIITVATIPGGLVAMLFMEPLLLLVFHGRDTALGVAPIASWLLGGTILNVMAVIPWQAQLACGWTGLGARLNTLFCVIGIPACLLLVAYLGAFGGAIYWLGLNLLFLVVNVPLMHRHLLPGVGRQWFARDLVSPLAASILVVGLGWWAWRYAGGGILTGVGTAAIVWLGSTLLLLHLSPDRFLWRMAVQRIQLMRGRS